MARVSGNYLRMHRKRIGLSQRELGLLIGYQDQGQVGRHELSRTAPPLLVALAYEVIFRVPVSELFTEMHKSVTHAVEGNLQTFEESLRHHSDKSRMVRAVGQKSKWLAQRKARM